MDVDTLSSTPNRPASLCVLREFGVSLASAPQHSLSRPGPRTDVATLGSVEDLGTVAELDAMATDVTAPSFGSDVATLGSSSQFPPPPPVIPSSPVRTPPTPALVPRPAPPTGEGDMAEVHTGCTGGQVFIERGSIIFVKFPPGPNASWFYQHAGGGPQNWTLVPPDWWEP